jgi:hypothetical protein
MTKSYQDELEEKHEEVVKQRDTMKLYCVNAKTQITKLNNVNKGLLVGLGISVGYCVFNYFMNKKTNNNKDIEIKEITHLFNNQRNTIIEMEKVVYNEGYCWNGEGELHKYIKPDTDIMEINEETNEETPEELLERHEEILRRLELDEL